MQKGYSLKKHYRFKGETVPKFKKCQVCHQALFSDTAVCYYCASHDPFAYKKQKKQFGLILLLITGAIFVLF